MSTCTEDILAQPTEEDVVRNLTEWATGHPSARFVVATLDHDDLWDSNVLGWGIAFPDHVVIDFPDHHICRALRSVDELRRMFRPEVDVRLIWVDPEPQRWPDEDDVP